MKKLNIPLSQIKKFAGQWVAVDTIADKIVGAGKTLAEISPLVIHAAAKKIKPSGPYAFKVPRNDEGPHYVL